MGTQFASSRSKIFPLREVPSANLVWKRVIWLIFPEAVVFLSHVPRRFQWIPKQMWKIQKVIWCIHSKLIIPIQNRTLFYVIGRGVSNATASWFCDDSRLFTETFPEWNERCFLQKQSRSVIHSLQKLCTLNTFDWFARKSHISLKFQWNIVFFLELVLFFFNGNTPWNYKKTKPGQSDCKIILIENNLL